MNRDKLAKSAEDYSDIEIFKLAKRIQNIEKDKIILVIFEEMRLNRLISSNEEGMKLLKILSNYKVYERC